MPALQDIPTAQREFFSWLKAPFLVAVIEALEKFEPNSVRFVGGCVRDSLFGHAPKDFDLATTLKPDDVIHALESGGLRAAPTGIDHGTVIAISDHQGVEITTLRADVSTDGRRAVVAFTNDWAVDAKRRDFRLNALYLTPDGRLFDPVGGLADIKTHTVQFIGDAETRIREDYLRILRFFRFSARFAGEFSEAGLLACAGLAEGIGTLSAERVGAEFMSILQLPRAAFALRAMERTGVLNAVWATPADIDAVEKLKTYAGTASAPLCLAALFDDINDDVGARLRLSNAERALRLGALEALENFQPDISTESARVMVYRLGKDGYSDAIDLAAAKKRMPKERYLTLRDIADEWTPPACPIAGKDVLAAGVAPGPTVSHILRDAEQQWISEGFPDPSRAREILLEIIAKL